jgi:hypothetical protein
LRQALSVTLGIPPSQATEALHKALLDPSFTEQVIGTEPPRPN